MLDDFFTASAKPPVAKGGYRPEDDVKVNSTPVWDGAAALVVGGCSPILGVLCRRLVVPVRRW
eukprot:5163048-Amphidinium_carterae.3